MKYQSKLEFLLQFCKKHKLNAGFYPQGSDITALDLHLRELLRCDQEYRLFEEFMSHQCKKNTIYKIIDQFHCVYYMMQFPGETETCPFVVGPYLQIRTNYASLTQYLHLYAISSQTLLKLQQIFSQIPFLTNDTTLQVFFQTFGEVIWGTADNFKFRIIDYNLDKALYPLTPHSHTIEDEQHIEAQFLDMYLTQENNLIQAVSQGQTAKAEEFLSTLHTFLFINKEEDSLRGMKNYALALNALLRKVTEINTVNSYQIMQVFSQFSHKIEHTTSPEACTALLREIVRKYCMLVKNHSAMQYSVLVQQAIKYINLDLTSDLSLHSMAERLNVNASYLSTHFKKVTGTTYTDYVNRKRIDHSLLLLNTSTLQIQTIAQHCGIPDLNYFTKLFKKYIHMSPTSYRKEMLDK